ncbi:MAG TPA: hypothetical protein VG317_06675 [Pseudonocardiaceae bacterium]|nr:hypothetical protein [Pseudonocardiaceae bacterium]
MTGNDGVPPGWGAPPPGGPAPQYNQPQYNQPYYPQQPQQYPQQPPQYPQQPPQYPQQPPQYPPPQQPYYPPPQYPYQQPQYQTPQQPSGQPIVIPIEGRGVAKLAARMKPRSITVSPEGFAHEDKSGAFRVAWSDLRRIAITTAYHRAQVFGPKVWRVRVVLDAADQGFAQRHPEIGGLQGKFGGAGPGSYGLPLGPVHNIVDQLAQALAMYGGQVFGGVIEEGQVIGFSYL